MKFRHVKADFHGNIQISGSSSPYFTALTGYDGREKCGLNPGPVEIIKCGIILLCFLRLFAAISKLCPEWPGKLVRFQPRFKSMNHFN